MHQSEIQIRNSRINLVEPDRVRARSWRCTLKPQTNTYQFRWRAKADQRSRMRVSDEGEARLWILT